MTTNLAGDEKEASWIQRDKEEVKTFSSIHLTGQESYPLLQHLKFDLIDLI